MERPSVSSRTLGFALAVLALLLAATAFPAAAAGGDDGGKAPTYRYVFSWRTDTHALAPVEGGTDEGASTPVAFALARANLTGVVAVLAWEDPVGGPDTLTLTLSAPGARTWGPQEGSEGRIELAAPLGAAPEGEVVIEAATAEAAWEEFLRRSPTRTDGRGDWSAEVAVVEAGDEVVAGVVTEEDTGTNWTLQVSYTSYVGVLLRKENVASPDPGACKPAPCKDATNRTDPPGSEIPGAPRPKPAPASSESVLFTPARMAMALGAATVGAGFAIVVSRRK